MNDLYLHPPGLVCAAGHDRDALRDALIVCQASGVQPDEQVWPGHRLHLGRVTQPLPSLDDLPRPLRSRNNALLLAALQQIRGQVDAALNRHGPARIGVVLGTSTSGVAESERALPVWRRDGQWPADYEVSQQELGSPARLLAHLLGLGGPCYVVSTACSSSAKALASGARLLRAGLCDAVIVGGVDALCAMTVAGFHALESVDPQRCRPFSADRAGINIGEGAALFLLDREPDQVRLAGWGETSDAHHISAPEPAGAGALSAMQQALTRARLSPADIGYLNLHGTATRQNDQMEARAVSSLFGPALPCSSTKPLTGHTLGAAGALEAAIAWLTLTGDGALPVHHRGGPPDPDLAPLRLVAPGERLARAPRHVLSNSFAFGGNNASLVLSHD